MQNSNEKNDKNLVELTLLGEQKAYEELVVRYQKRIVEYVNRFTKSRSMAEDAAQDAFVTAWMKLDELREPDKFYLWVRRIAKNCAFDTVRRFNVFLPYDTFDNYAEYSDQEADPAKLLELSERDEELHKTIERLSPRSKQVICLHYFEDLSVSEISKRLNVSEGTVKWQLHEGRKTIRKELCAMNESYNDTLVERVMKKVEELKLWKLKTVKTGFENAYNDLLLEIDALPESQNKNRALSDTLMRGWWWLGGKRNNDIFLRMKGSAVKSGNEEVMGYVADTEICNIPFKNRIEYIKSETIPFLEKNGFKTALAKTLISLAYICYNDGKIEEGNEAANRALALTFPSQFEHALAAVALKAGEELSALSKKKHYYFRITHETIALKKLDGDIYCWGKDGLWLGGLYRAYDYFNIFEEALCVDSKLLPGKKTIGYSEKISNGNELRFVSDSETVFTPAGKFDGCCLWRITKGEESIVNTWYKKGVGVVRCEEIFGNIKMSRALKSFSVEKSEDLLPLKSGNKWEYVDENIGNAIEHTIQYSVAFENDSEAFINLEEKEVRSVYDPASYEDALLEATEEYWVDGVFHDVSSALERAEKLAKTNYEKALAKSISSAIMRICLTDGSFNPDREKIGYVNSSQQFRLKKEEEKVWLLWDNWASVYQRNGWEFDRALQYVDIYYLFPLTVGYLSNDWKDGFSDEIARGISGTGTLKTKLNCENGGRIETPAGVFEDTVKVTLDIRTEGIKIWTLYNEFVGKAEYWFANGVGIVRAEKTYGADNKVAVFELTSYLGEGKGYFPFADGFFRRYEAVGLKDGYISSVDYRFAGDGSGKIWLISDVTGVQDIPSAVQKYSSVSGELREEKLHNEGKEDKARDLFFANNFRIMLHFIARSSRDEFGNVHSTEINSYKLGLIKSFGDGSSVPDAWKGFYASRLTKIACNKMWQGLIDDGFDDLERAFEYLREWATYKTGEELDCGRIFGQIKYIKGMGKIKICKNETEDIDYRQRLDQSKKFLHYALAFGNGWKWPDEAVKDKRYSVLVDKARDLAYNS